MQPFIWVVPGSFQFPPADEMGRVIWNIACTAGESEAWLVKIVTGTNNSKMFAFEVNFYGINSVAMFPHWNKFCLWHLFI